MKNMYTEHSKNFYSSISNSESPIKKAKKLIFHLKTLIDIREMQIKTTTY